MTKNRKTEKGNIYRYGQTKTVYILFIFLMQLSLSFSIFAQNTLPVDSVTLVEIDSTKRIEINTPPQLVEIESNQGVSIETTAPETLLPPADIEISFVKDSATIAATDLYFNAVKINNNTSSPITGTISYTVPDSWVLMNTPSMEMTINPNDTTWLPVRLTPNPNATGNITYILTASFRTKDKFTSTNSYITIPSQVKWDITPLQSNLYFTENKPEDKIQVRLTNKGNTDELIRVQYKIGKLLSFTNNNNLSELINLRAYKDTILTRTVSSENQLRMTEIIRYEGMWRESAVRISASTEATKQTVEVQTRKLNSTLINRRDQSASPLNFSFQTYNLLSNQDPRSNFNVFGNVLFTKNRQVDYLVGIQNFYYTQEGNKNFDINRQLLYNIRYRDTKNRIHIGYNMSGGSLHSINGRGLMGSFNVDNRNSINYGVTQNPYNQSIGEYIGYNTSIKSISINTELTHENSSNGSYAASSALLGAGFRLFRNHSLALQIMGSKSDYITGGRDTSLLGLSFSAGYSVKYKDLEFSASAINSRYNYIRNAGREQYQLNSKYKVSENIRLLLYGNRQYYTTTVNAYNFGYPSNFNSNDFARMTVVFSGEKVSYQVGPSYTGSTRMTYNPTNAYSTNYSMYQPGIWSAASIKINSYSSVTPNLTVSNMRFFYTSNNPLTPSYSSTDNLYYSLGANYYDGIWMVNLSYTNGSTSDLYRNILVGEQSLVTKSIQIRPSYQNYFFNKTVKLTASINYAYYMPSGRENTTLNLKYDQFLKNGWKFFINTFVNSNTRIIEDQGRISSKDLNVVAGVVKEFNLQQPRLKYYNLRTVIFNDLNGDRLKSENEPPLSNILVNIVKMRSDSMTRSNLAEIELVTDVNGEIAVENLPESTYRLRFSPLTNLQSLYFLNGAEQSYYSNKNQTIYVPLTESNRIKGKIVVVRDTNSSEGRIDLGNVRVQAVGKAGETFSTLTDNTGSYILSVPSANEYKVKVSNVFGSQFSIDADEMNIQFGKNKTINLDFTFTEKAREIIFSTSE